MKQSKTHNKHSYLLTLYFHTGNFLQIVRKQTLKEQKCPHNLRSKSTFNTADHQKCKKSFMNEKFLITIYSFFSIFLGLLDSFSISQWPLSTNTQWNMNKLMFGQNYPHFCKNVRKHGLQVFAACATKSLRKEKK